MRNTCSYKQTMLDGVAQELLTNVTQEIADLQDREVSEDCSMPSFPTFLHERVQEADI